METLQAIHSIACGGMFMNKDEDTCTWNTLLEGKLADPCPFLSNILLPELKATWNFEYPL